MKDWRDVFEEFLKAFYFYFFIKAKLLHNRFNLNVVGYSDEQLVQNEFAFGFDGSGIFFGFGLIIASIEEHACFA